MSVERVRRMACYPEVDARIRAGHKLRDVARWIQQDQGELRGVKVGTLLAWLSKLKREMGAVGLLAATHPKEAQEVLDRVRKGVSELDMFESLAVLQWDRIMQFRAVEQALKFPNPKIDQSVRVLSEVLTKSHAVKMDLGVHGSRDLGTVTVKPGVADDVGSKYGKGAQEALLNPESRARVLAMLHRVTSLATRDDVGDVIDVGESDGSEDGEDSEV